MRRRNLILGSAISAILVGMSGAANAVSNLTPVGGSRPFALEPATTNTKWTMPVVRRQFGDLTTSIEDFYIKFQVTNGQFASGSAAPTLSVLTGPACAAPNPASTAIVVGGGPGNDYVVFRINGSSAPLTAGGTCFDLSGSVLTAPNAGTGSPIQIATINGTNYPGGISNPTSPKELDPAAASSWADFANAVSITMAPPTADCDTSDPIDLVPDPQTKSRRVFGPESQLDTGCGSDTFDSVQDEENAPGVEYATQISRGVIVDINGSRLEPNGVTSFESATNAVDSLTISVDDVTELPKPAITALCYDRDDSGTCGGTNENFELNPVAPALPSLTIPAGNNYKSNNGFLLTVNGSDPISPTTMHFDFTLAVAGASTAASRPGSDPHTVPYSVPSNEWTLAYANGTLLRSSWFTTPNPQDPANRQVATIRVSNAGALAANVITCNYFLDNGATGACGPFGSNAAPDAFNVIRAHNSAQSQVNPTLVPLLGTGKAARGYFEIVLDSKPDVTEGMTINYNESTNDRNTTLMRNLTELDDLLHPEVNVVIPGCGSFPLPPC